MYKTRGRGLVGASLEKRRNLGRMGYVFFFVFFLVPCSKRPKRFFFFFFLFFHLQQVDVEWEKKRATPWNNNNKQGGTGGIPLTLGALTWAPTNQSTRMEKYIKRITNTQTKESWIGSFLLSHKYFDNNNTDEKKKKKELVPPQLRFGLLLLLLYKFIYSPRWDTTGTNGQGGQNCVPRKIDFPHPHWSQRSWDMALFVVSFFLFLKIFCWTIFSIFLLFFWWPLKCKRQGQESSYTHFYSRDLVL